MNRLAGATGVLLAALAVAGSSPAAQPLQGHAAQLPAAQAARPPVAAAAATPAWTTYHLDNARTGNDTTEGKVGGASLAWTATNALGSATLDGQVYASPLVYGTSVYVVTENNTVYAFNTADGTFQWSVHLGTPRAASGLPCGNISPSVGITGTPVIDIAAAGGHGLIYMAGMTSEPHYRLYGVDLVTHAVPFNAIIDTGDIAVEGQRGALALANGNVYVPFGGRAGDCYDTDGTPYYGFVTAVPQNGAAIFNFVAAGTEASGIWAPGGEAVDASGNIYVALGNGVGPNTESVYKLSPTLAVVNQWRPSNFQALDNADADVGSIIPALIGGGDVFQNGKNGHGYVLSSSLVQQTADPGMVSCGGLTSDASFGASAYAAPYVYVPCANGLRAYSQSGHVLSAAWNRLTTFAGPPIVAGGNVWTMSNGNLYGFNATTGAQIANISVGSFSRFESPAAAGGKVFVPTTSGLKAYNLLGRCATAGLLPATTTQAAGSSVAFTASSTGCATPLYEYWVQLLNGTWHLKRGFMSDPTWSWDTTGLGPGTYTVHVWANQSGDSTARWEAFASSTVTLTGCTSASLSPSAPSQEAGSSVAFTATSGGCLNPLYEYWVRYPSGTWYLKRAFSTLATWTWSTAGLRPGAYTVHVWANQQGGSLARWEAFGTSTVTLTGCTAGMLSPASGSSTVGASVLFTATSSGCSTPLYELWLQDTAGKWRLMRGFGASTWTWSTAGWAKGVYHIHAWANQQGAYSGAFETYGSATRTLS
jgi:polyvinyl alcohol dehydrogenase (cytochrome)